VYAYLDVFVRLIKSFVTPPFNARIRGYVLCKGRFHLEESSCSLLGYSILFEITLDFHDGKNKPVVNTTFDGLIVNHLSDGFQFIFL